MPIQIRIHRSRKAVLTLALLYGALAILVLLIDYPLWLQLSGQLGLGLAMLSGWRQLGGSGSGPVRIDRAEGIWQVSWPGQPAMRVTAVRGLWVRPQLLVIQLKSTERCVSLWIPDDAVEPREHWQLRRLALSGVGQPSSAAR